MATSPVPLLALPSPSTSKFSPSNLFLSLHLEPNSSNSSTALTCYQQNSYVEIQSVSHVKKKKKRKPRPSFSGKLRDRWSIKNVSLREKFPWEKEQVQDVGVGDKEEYEENETCQHYSLVAETYEKSFSDSMGLDYGIRANVPPWVQGGKPRQTPQFHSEARISENIICEEELQIEEFNKNGRSNILNPLVQEWKASERVVIRDGERLEKIVRVDSIGKCRERAEENGIFGGAVKFAEISTGLREEAVASVDTPTDVTFITNSLNLNREFRTSVGSCGEENDSKGLGWEMSIIEGSIEKGKIESHTKLAESLIPDPELRRLRNVSLRMAERIKVGKAGVTRAIVDCVHEKWKVNEVVKLKFEGPHAINMKRIHEILESRTGGMVIWRSGSSVVLFRGMTYNFPCVNSCAKGNEICTETSQSSNNVVDDVSQRIGSEKLFETMISSTSCSEKYLKELSKRELTGFFELDQLLGELGPRFIDWSGRAPLPVDADLLPPLIPGYKAPFRLLPHGIKPGLRNSETTFLRRTARKMPPHFALGRNRDLQGLAMAMIKLWERSVIAKIAIKRGVPNTCNERMSEELKFLTGGTLLSRNKEYIVFYRGNDFLPSGITETLAKAQKIATLRQNEEEKVRHKTFTMIDSDVEFAKSQLIAGTLSENIAATFRWANQPSVEEREKLKKDLALARHAALVKYLERKLAVAKGKAKRAEVALKKVLGSLNAVDLPIDLETITNEERFLFRKIGLSMKPYLLLGRRGIFDGTIENMHLHWKYRELVKIVVEGKSFPLVKHIAISLEAESGGLLVSIDRTTKGYVIIIYRGKNYQRPREVRPNNLLTRREALARSIELQRLEALKHHIMELQERIEKLKSDWKM